MFEQTKALSEADKKMGDFAPIVKGMYVLTVRDAEEGETEERVWEGAGFVNTGNMVPQLTLKFLCAKENGENVIPNINGDPIEDPLYTVWISDANLGWNKKLNQPKQGRAVLAALLGKSPDGDISFNSPNELVGKKMKVYMSIETNKAGKERNVLVDINPV